MQPSSSNVWVLRHGYRCLFWREGVSSESLKGNWESCLQGTLNTLMCSPCLTWGRARTSLWVSYSLHYSFSSISAALSIHVCVGQTLSLKGKWSGGAKAAGRGVQGAGISRRTRAAVSHGAPSLLAWATWCQLGCWPG